MAAELVISKLLKVPSRRLFIRMLSSYVGTIKLSARAYKSNVFCFWSQQRRECVMLTPYLQLVNQEYSYRAEHVIGIDTSKTSRRADWSPPPHQAWTRTTYFRLTWLVQLALLYLYAIRIP